MNLRSEAYELYQSGLNVLPAIKAQKRPVGCWKRYAESRHDFDAVFPADLKFDAIAVVCGATSGGLEIIDFDQHAALYPQWRAAVNDIAADLPVESTQNGGKHVAFRSSGCGRNQKLATTGEGCAIETRGEGGICIIAPTDGYVLESGDWRKVPVLSREERQAILDAARSLSSSPMPVETPPRPSAPLKAANSRPVGSSRKYGESASDYMKRVQAGKESLKRAGWRFLYAVADWEYWERPGQPVAGKPGGSFSIKDGFFHCFTSNGAPLEQDRNYSHLQLVAALDYDGDQSAAARDWARKRNAEERPIEDCFAETRAHKTSIAFNPFYPPEDERYIEDDTKPPVDLPQQLFECGGMIQEIQDMTNQYAFRPQPEGAFLGALATMSFLAGRSIAIKYIGNLVTPNIYSVFLAPSGMGKDIIRRVSSDVVSAYSPDESIPENFASVQALQNMISRTHKLMWLHDEFGRDLAVMNSEKANPNVVSIITECLRLYSSASDPNYLPKIVAQEAKGAKKIESVDRPSLTIFATGNPDEYFMGSNEMSLLNGYVARFTIVQGRTYSKKKTVTFEEAKSSPRRRFDESLRSRIRDWYNLEQKAADGFFEVGFNKEAFDCITDFDNRNESIIKNSEDKTSGLMQFRSRLSEKVWKYALLFTASKYGAREDLAVDRDCAENAVALAEYESNYFNVIQLNFSSNHQTRFIKKILEWGAEQPGRCFRHSDFSRRFQRYGRSAVRNEALKTMLEADYLKEIKEKGTGAKLVTSYLINIDDKQIKEL